MQRGPDFGVTLGRTEAHHDVIGLNERFQPWLEGERKIECRKRALSNDDGMDEFHGDVLGVRCVGPAAKCEESATAKESLGHFAASFR
jgi:hypothetical protein